MELAAKESPSTASALVRVSKVVYDWVMPILYHTVQLRDHDNATLARPDAHTTVWCHHATTLKLFHRMTQTEFSSATAHVRNIYLVDYCLPPQATHDILSRCSQVERIVLCSLSTYLSPAQKINNAHHLRQLWELVLIAPSSNILDWPQQRIFHNITHVFLYHDLGWYDIYYHGLSDLFSALPSITHFCGGCSAMASRRLIQWIASCLSPKSTFKNFLLYEVVKGRISRSTTLDGPAWVELAKTKDERLLVMDYIPFENPAELLESGKTVWDDAKEKYGNWRDIVRLSAPNL